MLEKYSPLDAPPNISCWSGFRDQSANKGFRELRSIRPEKRRQQTSLAKFFRRIPALATFLISLGQRLAYLVTNTRVPYVFALRSQAFDSQENFLENQSQILRWRRRHRTLAPSTARS